MKQMLQDNKIFLLKIR